MEWQLNISFSFCSITESFVLKPLKTLKTNKAIGLDRISARLLKDYTDQTFQPVTWGKHFSIDLEM